MNKTTPLKRSVATLMASALVTAATLATSPTNWSEESLDMLLPSEAYPLAGKGNDIMIDPLSDSANPGLFLGIGYTAGSTLFRLSPSEPPSGAYSVEPLNVGLSLVQRLAYVPGIGLYAIGSNIDPKVKNPPELWKVRKSIDGNNWSDEDTFALGKNALARAIGFTADHSGNLFATGVAAEGRGSHWIVRRKTPSGAWATVFDAKGNHINMVPSVCSFPGNSQNPTPSVFATSELNSRWTVLRSQNQGNAATWVACDTLAGVEASPYDAVCDPPTGRLYVLGCRGLNAINPSGWIIRMSDDGGNTWRTLLDAPATGSWASRATVDPAGNISVSGVVRTPSGRIPLWTVVRCANPVDPDSWSEAYHAAVPLLGDITSSKGRGIAYDASGNLFVTGEVSDWIDPITGAKHAGINVGLFRLVP